MNDICPELNSRFAIPGRVEFAQGAGGLPMATITSAGGTATVMLHGGHVLSFIPTGGEPVLWLSQYSSFEDGKPIRGGIPVCWPWFGQHPDAIADMPMHGFARICDWEIVETSAPSPELSHIRLRFADSAKTAGWWQYKFCLELLVTVGKELRLELKSFNQGTEPLHITAALHTYFNVSDVRQISIDGLVGTEFINSIAGHCRGRDAEPVRFSGEFDRVYVDTAADCLINDPGLSRRIRVAKSGSTSTVVWNPWIDKAKRMPDFGDAEYPEMVCVETARTKSDPVLLQPGASHEMTATLSVESLP